MVLELDMSLTPNAYAVEIKALNAAGDSTDRAITPIDRLSPVRGNNGWTDRGAIENARFTVHNTQPIPLDLVRYPAPDRVTFVERSRRVVYSRGVAWGPPPQEESRAHVPRPRAFA